MLFVDNASKRVQVAIHKDLRDVLVLGKLNMGHLKIGGAGVVVEVDESVFSRRKVGSWCYIKVNYAILCAIMHYIPILEFYISCFYHMFLDSYSIFLFIAYCTVYQCTKSAPANETMLVPEQQRQNSDYKMGAGNGRH